MTIHELTEAIRAELTDLMASRKSNPAMTLGHAFRILRLLDTLNREHDRALWVARGELEIERYAADAANDTERQPEC